MTVSINLSKVCFGCEPLGGSDWGNVDLTDIRDAIERALDLGVNFFDTADVYGLGLSEIRLSQILGIRRHDVVIATKGGMAWDSLQSGERASIRKDSSPKYLQSAVEASLRRLRLERLPIYFIHWPDPNTDIRSSFECLARLQHVGKIGLIGCSNFSAKQIRLACEVSDVSLVQLPLNILENDLEFDIQQAVQDHGIRIVTYNVLANGLLTGKYGPDSCFPANDRRSRLPLFQGVQYQQALARIKKFSIKAAEQGLTCAQYAITEVLKSPKVSSVILGIKNKQQIEENCSVLVNK